MARKIAPENEFRDGEGTYPEHLGEIRDQRDRQSSATKRLRRKAWYALPTVVRGGRVGRDSGGGAQQIICQPCAASTTHQLVTIARSLVSISAYKGGGGVC